MAHTHKKPRVLTTRERELRDLYAANAAQASEIRQLGQTIFNLQEEVKVCHKMHSNDNEKLGTAERINHTLRDIIECKNRAIGLHLQKINALQYGPTVPKRDKPEWSSCATCLAPRESHGPSTHPFVESGSGLVSHLTGAPWKWVENNGKQFTPEELVIIVKRLVGGAAVW